jgi:hypothetical protein
LDHSYAPIRSPAQKSIASSGHIELCTNLSAEKIDAYAVDALDNDRRKTEGMCTIGEQTIGEQKARAPAGKLTFLNEKDALRAYERATGNQSSKHPRSPKDIEKLILDQFGKDSTSYRYICLSKKIEGNQGQIFLMPFFFHLSLETLFTTAGILAYLLTYYTCLKVEA